MRMRELPTKYYLTHFHEFIGFITSSCEHLLDNDDVQFIDQFKQLPEDAQCIFVRGQNRKSPIIKTASLHYEEISHFPEHFDLLLCQGFYQPLGKQHINDVIETLTKPELIEVLAQTQLSFKRSESKSTLFEQVKSSCTVEDFNEILSSSQRVHRGYEKQLRYFLYLFFGDLSSGLNKFSMRDMGIMRTKKGVRNDAARFDYIEEAKSAYFYAHHSRNMHQLSQSELLSLASELQEYPSPQGTLANTNYDRFTFKLGKAILTDDTVLALTVLSLSNEPLAQEKVIRERYKLGEKDWVKLQLAQIIDTPDSEALLAFAEDFLERKFNQKRTSILTDMMRENTQPLLIDEMYMNAVEYGVKLHYQKQGKQAFKTENRLWRALFGLAFWEELFETDNNALITEFDYKPQSIIQNCFYENFEQAIETRLYRMTSPQMAFKQISKVLLEKYGTPNGIFLWHKSLLEVLAVYFGHVDIESLTEHLRAMAKDFKVFADGYPDLMVVDDQGMKFEEIKGPGDSLRKNQLLTIRQLRKTGFNVAITPVKWYLDPLQTYAVIDIETTGGRAGNHRITEIGIAKVIGDQVIDTWQTLLNPQRHIPRNITNLTGIDNDMVADAPIFVEIADKLREYLAGCVFVAHNVNFDYGFIRAEYERIEQGFRMPKLCTVREMRKAVPGLPSYSLANLTKHFGIDMSRHHRALSDAQAAAELLFIINESRRQLAEK